MNWLLATVAMCAAHLSVPQQSGQPKNTFLYTELIGMEMADQEVRGRLIDALKNKQQPSIELIKEMERVDAANRARLKQIIREQGWPTRSMVGKEASNAAWLIVQHSDSDVAFQAEMLKTLEPFVKQGEVAKQDYAYLWDRVAKNQGRKQRYGTQGAVVGDKWVLSPTEDLSKLDKRRAEVGLPPMREYYKLLKEMLGVKSAGPG